MVGGGHPGGTDKTLSLGRRIGATGFYLITVCSGFARFAFGLPRPQIEGNLSLGSSMSGVITAGYCAGYCAAIFASAVITKRIDARAAAAAAALIAVVGLAGIALAPSPLFLAVAVVVAGSSTASPA